MKSLQTFLTENKVELNEALGGLADLPKYWLAAATKAYGHIVGEGSKVESVEKIVGAARSDSGMWKIMKRVIAATLDGSYEFSWLEVDGKPFMGVSGSPGVFNGKEVTLFLNNGTHFSVPASDMTSKGGSKKVGGEWKYVPPTYYKYDKKSFKANDAADRMFWAFKDLVRAEGAALNAAGDIDWKLLKDITLEIRALTPDANRAQTKADRKDAKGNPNARGFSPEMKSAMKKKVLEKIDTLVSETVAQLPSKTEIQRIVDLALDGKASSELYKKNGKTAFDIQISQSTIDSYKKIKDILYALNSASTDNYVEKSYGGDGAKVKWSMERLVQELK